MTTRHILNGSPQHQIPSFDFENPCGVVALPSGCSTPGWSRNEPEEISFECSKAEDQVEMRAAAVRDLLSEIWAEWVLAGGNAT